MREMNKFGKNLERRFRVEVNVSSESFRSREDRILGEHKFGFPGLS
jgi:hypothetical protein